MSTDRGEGPDGAERVALPAFLARHDEAAPGGRQSVRAELRVVGAPPAPERARALFTAHDPLASVAETHAVAAAATAVPLLGWAANAGGPPLGAARLRRKP